MGDQRHVTYAWISLWSVLAAVEIATQISSYDERNWIRLLPI